MPSLDDNGFLVIFEMLGLNALSVAPFGMLLIFKIVCVADMQLTTRVAMVFTIMYKNGSRKVHEALKTDTGIVTEKKSDHFVHQYQFPF